MSGMFRVASAVSKPPNVARVNDHFRAGQSLARSLMNHRVERLVVHSPVLDVGAGIRREGAYQDLIPSFHSLEVHSIDLFEGTEPSVVGNLEIGLPFRNESFQTCLAFNVLEHIFDFRRALGELHRVLASTGHIYIFVPFLYRVHADPSDYYRYTAHAWNRLLVDAGFDDVVVESLGWGAVTAALGQVDFLIGTVARSACLRGSVLVDRIISKRSGERYRNADDYPIGLFVGARKRRLQVSRGESGHVTEERKVSSKPQ